MQLTGRKANLPGAAKGPAPTGHPRRLFGPALGLIAGLICTHGLKEPAPKYFPNSGEKDRITGGLQRLIKVWLRFGNSVSELEPGDHARDEA